MRDLRLGVTPPAHADGHVVVSMTLEDGDDVMVSHRGGQISLSLRPRDWAQIVAALRRIPAVDGRPHNPYAPTASLDIYGSPDDEGRVVMQDGKRR